MTTHPKRRFFRYSLRTLMLVVTLICVWLGITVKRAREQRSAVEAIQKLGGDVYYEHQFINSNDPPGPEWLRQLIGDEYFFSVAIARLYGSKVNDTSLASIKRLTDLKWLELHDTHVTDEGVKRLQQVFPNCEIKYFSP